MRISSQEDTKDKSRAMDTSSNNILDTMVVKVLATMRNSNRWAVAIMRRGLYSRRRAPEGAKLQCQIIGMG